MRFLSFDCANKSLAYVYMEVFPENMRALITGLAEYRRNANAWSAYKSLSFLQELAQLKLFRIDACDVVDILDGIKVAEVSVPARAKLLRAFLVQLGAKLQIAPDTIVLVEDQPNRIMGGAGASGGFQVKTNLATVVIAGQIAFYFADHEVVLINPKLKNGIAFSYALKVDVLASAGKKYAARKKQAKANCRYILSLTNQSAATAHIGAAYYDDVADAVMQVFAYVKKIKAV